MEWYWCWRDLLMVAVLAWGLHTSWVWVIVSLDSIQMINYTGIGSEWVTGKNENP